MNTEPNFGLHTHNGDEITYWAYPVGRSDMNFLFSFTIGELEMYAQAHDLTKWEISELVNTAFNPDKGRHEVLFDFVNHSRHRWQMVDSENNPIEEVEKQLYNDRPK